MCFLNACWPYCFNAKYFNGENVGPSMPRHVWILIVSLDNTGRTNSLARVGLISHVCSKYFNTFNPNVMLCSMISLRKCNEWCSCKGRRTIATCVSSWLRPVVPKLDKSEFCCCKLRSPPPPPPLPPPLPVVVVVRVDMGESGADVGRLCKRCRCWLLLCKDLWNNGGGVEVGGKGKVTCVTWLAASGCFLEGGFSEGFLEDFLEGASDSSEGGGGRGVALCFFFFFFVFFFLFLLDLPRGLGFLLFVALATSVVVLFMFSLPVDAVVIAAALSLWCFFKAKSFLIIWPNMDGFLFFPFDAATNMISTFLYTVGDVPWLAVYLDDLDDLDDRELLEEEQESEEE